METLTEKYFHRIDKYCIINCDIKYIFTLKAILINGKSEILKYFFLYDVLIFKWNACLISSDPPFIEWHVRCTFETFISPSFPCVTFAENPQIKIISFQNT